MILEHRSFIANNVIDEECASSSRQVQRKMTTRFLVLVWNDRVRAQSLLVISGKGESMKMFHVVPPASR